MQDNTYRHPRAGWPGRVFAALANCAHFAELRQAVMSRLPFLNLHSDVRDVVYVSWLVDAAAAQNLLPPGVALWQRDGKTPFTVLTYRHGHFGPALLGPLRRLLPSPLQSNWRLYLDHTPPGAPAVPCVYFLKNIMASLPHALGTRLFSDILPTHLAAGMALEVTATQARCSIASGAGSAPALDVQAAITAAHGLDTDWQQLFGNWRDAVAFLACQDGAIAHVPRNGKLVFGEIDLPVDVDQVQALTPLRADCGLLGQLPPASKPFAFLVPKVAFKALSERLL
ncbi:hypothetical protein JAB5_19690 [Janthinobacterium sp. HH103]|uniref:DUF2071 domain-containing protein n=1 Tax=unclassified Janthinobacterium TaxID=2610881 RepID=UPI000892CD7D|nr:MULTISPECIES: DUF2071 domain-containing protein [unclassified Janthinobacterium]OEZ66786.1 hypothetical protein JAB2_28120 [Janthinobacterium sp. HH100]OEZ80783.1 hypothetical protein JAB5_19690 [Janthinobacterium sp. HH103]OEZ91934.1 hypothetical protein JAB8_11840 [Janthinobacterium sp. HH106]QOU72756.1 hypothetical protein JAB4_021940 [Janthinobacterium sp. HH102]